LEKAQPKKAEMVVVLATIMVPPLLPTPRPNMLEPINLTLFESLQVADDADVQP